MLLSFILPFLLATPSVVSQADLECPNGDLQTYLLALIDVLYDNGLTAFEDFIVHLSETDEGYELLEAIYTAPFLTILPPVDSAFQIAGLQSPYSNVGNGSLVDLLSYMTLQGDWGYDKLPQGPLKAVANSSLILSGSIGDAQSTFKGQVLQQGEGGMVSVRMAVGNSTSWAGSIDLSPYPTLDNLRILPVDTLIPVPPKLGNALKLPTSTRSANGFTKFVETFLPSGAGSLEQIPQTGGLTIFVPVDDAFENAQPGAIQSHYSTTKTLWSPDWSYPGTYPGFLLDSGDTATLTYNGTGSYISIEGGASAQILRSDISLENGAMHIIDTVLSGPGGSSTSTPNSSDPGLTNKGSQPFEGSGGTASGGTSGKDVDGNTGSGSGAGTGTGAGAGNGGSGTDEGGDTGGTVIVEGGACGRYGTSQCAVFGALMLVLVTIVFF